MSDAYATVRMGPVSGIVRKTEAKFETVNAVWETKFLFEDIRLTDDEFKKEKLAISVYDRNTFARNELIGSHEFSLTNIQRQRGSQYDRKWFPLTLPEQPGHIRGHVLLTAYVLKAGAEPPHSEDREKKEEEKTILTEPEIPYRTPFLLNVLIYRGAHILENTKLPLGGDRNPFVVVRFNGNVAETPQSFNTGSPVWNYKLSLPFNMPLTSESIEIQLWNKVSVGPSQLISEETFNYYNQGLTHKAWGPRWVNLYSSEYTSKQVSWFGSLKDGADASGRNNPFKSEYVGRLLLRMSVATTDRGNQRLLVMPCNPASMPATVEYCLDLLLYQSQDIPVMGGQVKVEVTFGDRRAESTARLGENGVFIWMETLTPVVGKYDKPLEDGDPMRLSLRVHGPADLEQLHDISISVFHIVGSSTRKIGFLRLKPVQMLPRGGLDSYFVNGQYPIPRRGMLSPAMLKEMWAPRWYTLNHVNPDPDNPQLVAGFLLMTIGFGVTTMRPISVPQPVRMPRTPVTLRCYIYQGANLLTADSTTMSTNPFLVVRFGEVSYRTRTIKDTTFPFWAEWADIGPVYIDKERPPSVFLQLYHQTQLQYKLIGRCDILGKHVRANTLGKLFRYQLYYDPHESQDDELHGGNAGSNSGSSAGDNNGNNSGGNNNNNKSKTDREKMPYVLACFQIIPYYKDKLTKFKKHPLKKDWVPKKDEEAKRLEAEKRKNKGTESEEEEEDDTDNEGNTLVKKSGKDSNDTEEKATTAASRKVVQMEQETGSKLTPEEELEEFLKNVYWRPETKPFACKLEMIGLRDIRNWQFSDQSRLRVEVTIPMVEGQARRWKHENIEKRELVRSYEKTTMTKPEGTAIQILEMKQWDDVMFPVVNPNGLPLRVRLFDERAGGSVLLGVSYTLLYQDGHMPLDDAEVPDFYLYTGYWQLTADQAMERPKLRASDQVQSEAKVELVEDEDEDEDREAEETKAGPDIDFAALGVKVYDRKAARKAREAAAAAARANGTTGEEGGETGAAAGDEDGAAAAAAAAAAMDDDESDEDGARVKVKFRGALDKTGNPALDLEEGDDKINTFAEIMAAPPNLLRNVESAKSAAAEAKEAFLEDENKIEHAPPLSIKLMAGKQVGFSQLHQSLLQVSSAVAWRDVAVARLYIRTLAMPEPPNPLLVGQQKRDAERKYQDNCRAVSQRLQDEDGFSWLNSNVFSQRYVTRVYVYEGRHLAPRESFLTGNQTVNPFLVVSNAPDADYTVNNRDTARVNSINPEFFQVFELLTEFPKNHMLEVGVWNRNDVSADDLIGTISLDVEELVMTNAMHGKNRFYVLQNTTSAMAQGKVRMRVDLFTEEDARRIRAEDLVSQDPVSYELRMVLWSSKDVRMPEEKDRDKDVDQTMSVTVNFDGAAGEDIIKNTDTAWYAEGGAADWHHRMVWSVNLPALHPRVKLTMWDDKMIDDREAIGEVIYNLGPMFEMALRDKKPMIHKPQQWIAFTHPNYPGQSMGEVCVEFWLYTKVEAEKEPVGEERDEPNRNPYLSKPHRNPPPWAIGSRGLDWIQKRKMLAIAIIIIFIVIIVVVIAAVLATRK